MLRKATSPATMGDAGDDGAATVTAPDATTGPPPNRDPRTVAMGVRGVVRAAILPS
jgi:hypothetical protein